ncbi:MAG: SIS domain-containing protein [Nitrospinales bacterium]
MQQLNLQRPRKKHDAESIIDCAKNVLNIESRSIAALAGRLDDTFVRVVSLLDQCERHVVVTGIGKSGLVGQKIAATFSSIGVPALFLHATDGSHGDVGIISPGAIVIAISNSGESEEILKLLPFFNRINATLISLTGHPGSTLANHSDYVLDASVEEEACSLGLVPTASVAAALAMGDALAMAVLEKRGFNEEDFAQYHPGGALGRKLLTTVADLMHSGEDIPKVFEKSHIYKVITEMSGKRLGSTIVVDEDDRLRGIITDGDLRRLIESKKDIAAAIARELMSLRPKTVTKGDLAAKALKIMRENSITALVVLEDNEKISGIVHLHDILKAGIV